MPSIPQPLVPDDDGGAVPEVAAALAAFHAGTAGPADVLNALAGARLLVPVVAVLTESEVSESGLRQEKESEMALPKLVGQDGRQAVLAFTGAESLARWRPDARPIQVTALQVCSAAVGEGAAAVVVDVAGPVQFVIEGASLEAMAAVAEGRLPEQPEAETPATHAEAEAPATQADAETPAARTGAPVSGRKRFGWLRRGGS